MTCPTCHGTGLSATSHDTACAACGGAAALDWIKEQLEQEPQPPDCIMSPREVELLRAALDESKCGRDAGGWKRKCAGLDAERTQFMRQRDEYREALQHIVEHGLPGSAEVARRVLAGDRSRRRP